MKGGEQEHRGDREHHAVGPAAPQVDLLEARIAEGRDHEHRQRQQHTHQQQVEPRLPVTVGHHEQDRRQRAGGGRRRQADEVALVDLAGLDVEAGEPGRRADQEEERRQPAGAPELLEPPQIGEQRRGHAERHQVGERVVLLAEVALGAGHARDAAVEAVEDRRREDEQRRRSEAAAQAEHHRVEAEQHVGDGEDAGQQVGPPAQAARAGGERGTRAGAAAACATRRRRCAPLPDLEAPAAYSWEGPAGRARATGVVPPRSRAPGSTRTS